ncbi:MAG: type II toxin-antitoxin system VapC family toxin [Candidatus Sumerlaeota bacterium]|nr:type II toxin-antitoxin system VapC family toxin [Candidatus Sumerlaeota bacterium]
MKILLDTHIFLWWTLNDSRLPIGWRKAFENPENTIFLSAASVWEMSIKKDLGRLVIDADISDWIRRYFAELDLSPLSISFEHALAVRLLPIKHKDPFDRMLIAQSIHENMHLATMDEIIRQYDAQYFG